MTLISASVSGDEFDGGKDEDGGPGDSQQNFGNFGNERQKHAEALYMSDLAVRFQLSVICTCDLAVRFQLSVTCTCDLVKCW
jgi:hypothetical protein